MDIGFCGTGRMGAAMVERLLDVGHRLTVWNRTADKLKPLAARGAHVVASPAAMVAETELVITVTAEGSYRVNERTLINSSTDTLRTALLKEAGSERGPITIRADARSTHQAVVTAMDVAGHLGFSQLNIATVHEDKAP